jgi:hypothetical protein
VQDSKDTDCKTISYRFFGNIVQGITMQCDKLIRKLRVLYSILGTQRKQVTDIYQRVKVICDLNSKG